MPNPIEMTMSGGLGNQLFQVSAGIYLEEVLGRPVIYNVSNLLGSAKSSPGNYTRSLEIYELLPGKKLKKTKPHWLLDLIITRAKRKFLGRIYIFENNQNDRVLSKVSAHTKGIFGFYQDASVTETSWNSLKARMLNSTKFSPLVTSEKINRIAIHLRFGDYSDDPKTKKTYGLTHKNYYLQALSEFQKMPDCPDTLAIITDNKTMAQVLINNVNFSGPIEYISNETAIQDLTELARSTHVIMSNSTFSWWGAWIANKVHNAKVIYPRPWMADSSDPELPIFVKSWTSLKRKYETN